MKPITKDNRSTHWPFMPKDNPTIRQAAGHYRRKKQDVWASISSLSGDDPVTCPKCGAVLIRRDLYERPTKHTC